MVSVREIERTIQQNNSCVQWEREAKVRFSKHMKLLRNHFVKEVEKHRTDKRRRMTPQVVDNTCVNILHIINEGEKNGE